MSVAVETDSAREHAIGVALALTASSMLGVTIAFARIALGARGAVPNAAWGMVLTAAWLLADPPARHGRPARRDASESIAGGEERAEERGLRPADASGLRPADASGLRIAPSPDDRERASVERMRSWRRGASIAAARGVGVFLLELALLLRTLRSAAPLLVALLAWHTLHAALAAIVSLRARDATVVRLVTRFAAASWFAVALVVWGLA